MKTKFFLIGIFAIAGMALAASALAGLDDLRTPPRKPKPPHCDPWIGIPPPPPPPPTGPGDFTTPEEPEPTIYPEPIVPGNGPSQGDSPQAHAYGDCDDEEPTPSPTPTPPPPTDDPGDPGEPPQQNFPNDPTRPELFIHGSGILSCSLNASAGLNPLSAFFSITLFLIPALWRRARRSK